MVSNPAARKATQGRTWGSPTKAQGAAAGSLTVVGFAVVHAAWISDIWFNIVPMVVSGGVCGLCIVWSYQHAVDRRSPGRWLAYNSGCAALLVALGGASLLVFAPRFTMAEVLAADDALARLLPPALPLMAGGTLAGTVGLCALFSRRRSALLPILVTQGLLMVLIGHNLAVLGLVDMPSDQWYRVGSLVGLTGFLAATFAASTLAITWARSRLVPRADASGRIKQGLAGRATSKEVDR